MGPAKQLTFVSYDSAEEKASARVEASLGEEVASRFGPRDETPLSIQAFDGGTLIGGLNGCTHWGWLYIRQFWVTASWRSRGVGRGLLQQAETQARMRNCIGIYLDTFDPGAAQFYARCGYSTFGQIGDFPPGHTRTFLYRKLNAE